MIKSISGLHGHGLKLYPLLVQNEYRFNFDIAISDLKEALNIDLQSYSDYKEFKKSGGVTRKSAASAKPKSAAAASVVKGTKTKKSKNTASGKRSNRRQQREKQYEAEKRYGDPPWKKFKIVKKM